MELLKAKIGKEYRSEVYNDAGSLYETTVTKWEHVDLGNETKTERWAAKGTNL